MAEIIYPDRLRDGRERSAFRQGFDAGIHAQQVTGRNADPEYCELRRWAVEQAEKLEANESALSSLKGAVGKVVEAGKVSWEDFNALSSALSELESQCSARAESKRREDAPSSAPGSDGGEL